MHMENLSELWSQVKEKRKAESPAQLSHSALPAVRLAKGVDQHHSAH